MKWIWLILLQFCLTYMVQAQSFVINKGITGTWYNSQTSGQGQLIEVLPDTQQIFLAWFTYTTTDESSVSQQQWWTALGPYSQSSSELILYQTENGLFNNSQAVETNQIGEVQLNFNDCNHGQLSYSLNSGSSGQIQITRLVADNLCEQLNEN